MSKVSEIEERKGERRKERKRKKAKWTEGNLELIGSLHGDMAFGRGTSSRCGGSLGWGSIAAISLLAACQASKFCRGQHQKVNDQFGGSMLTALHQSRWILAIVSAISLRSATFWRWKRSRSAWMVEEAYLRSCAARCCASSSYKKMNQKYFKIQQGPVEYLWDGFPCFTYRASTGGFRVYIHHSVDWVGQSVQEATSDPSATARRCQRSWRKCSRRTILNGWSTRTYLRASFVELRGAERGLGPREWWILRSYTSGS
jgi:hypothetical protein